MSAPAPGDKIPNLLMRTLVSNRLLYNRQCGKNFLILDHRALDSAESDVARLCEFTQSNDILCFGLASSLHQAQINSNIEFYIDDDKTWTSYFSELPPGGVVLADRNARILAISNLRDEGWFQKFSTSLDTDKQRKMQAFPPVMILHNVLSESFCAQLVEYAMKQSVVKAGVKRDIGGEYVYVEDPMIKRRDDFYIDDALLHQQVVRRLLVAILPEIERVFNSAVTRYDTLKMVRYRADERGYFRCHRDNVGEDTRHRKFALSLNLNAGQYEGGAIQFPEYSLATWVMPTGSAAIFSCSLAHEVLPVTKGERFALLSFLY